MSQVIVTADGNRFDLSLPEDRYSAVELACTVLESYRSAVFQILAKEKARKHPNAAYVRDLQNAFDSTRSLRRKLTGEHAEPLVIVLRDLLP